ncbi:MAG TPA: glycosyltransferase family 25 protein [Chitinophagaceae bacterium]|jgi:glycosyl transferase family 25|nr:glycosyltransferase family 25 protein [Chitinophagaceae bacterium]OPZ19458.1 MAG: Glycosyltransferase family 25 (LPS biosynthesis protein) [Bacteroidetes bacterium ADurb.BinA245]HMW65688.1 glycosyltransferase family 25 protein [Chitinophagaceae bacterium]HMX77222.1 glycosyltransferase family 25 protein [Chitinophagaceae bacterium]HNA91700.1 glycosyltransferase family 25 protein [Chitinophagaceae bacterium]
MLLELFSYLNSYYDKIYVLSVAAATERRKLFEHRFQGLKYSFFYGADKNKFSIEELISHGTYDPVLAKKHHRFSKIMKHGEIACSWSHRMMYEDMIANGYNRVLIMEDDAVPNEKQLQQLPAILSEIPENCELLFWGWDKNGDRNGFTPLKQLIYHLQHSLGKLKWDHTMIKNLYARPFSPHLKKAGFHDFTFAYSINHSGAKKLIEMQTPLQYIADNLLAHAATKEVLTAYICYPAVFLHDTLPDGSPRDSYIR